VYRDSRRLEEFKEYYIGYTVSSFFVCIADSQKIKTPVFVANIAFHRAINVTHSLFTDASSLYGIFHKESTSHSGWPSDADRLCRVLTQQPFGDDIFSESAVRFMATSVSS